MHDSEFIAAHPASIPSAARVVLSAMDGGGDVANAWAVLAEAIGHTAARDALTTAAGQQHGDVMERLRQAISAQHARTPPPVLAFVTLAVQVDPQAWALTYGHGPEESAVIADVRQYVLNHVQQSSAAAECALTARLY